MRGWSMAASGQSSDGIPFMAQGLAAMRAIGCTCTRPYRLVALADVHGKLGQPDEGLTCVAGAAQIIEAMDEQRDQAELHRVRGELLDAKSGRAAAEQNYLQAPAVSAKRGARVYELRAAASLWYG
jgi:hypothetical protein